MTQILKEYIELLIKEQLTETGLGEDIDISKASPKVLGIYAFAQAFNKLIYSGENLPGAIPIDIIPVQSGGDIPMATSTEKDKSFSFQFSGSSFKLYLNPGLSSAYLDPGTEAHDLVHAITSNLAKSFGRRRPSIQAKGNFSLSPSKFNKIKIPIARKQKIEQGFENYFGFPFPKEAWEQVFALSSASKFFDWWKKAVFTPANERIIYNKAQTTSAKNIKLTDLEKFGNKIYWEVKGDEFEAGKIGKKYYQKQPELVDVDPSKRHEPFQVDPSLRRKDTYHKGFEDEELLGNSMAEVIAPDIRESDDIELYKAKSIMSKYTSSTGLAGSEGFKHKYDTPEVEQTILTLIKTYNTLLDRYTKANIYGRKKKPHPKGQTWASGKINPASSVKNKDTK